MKKYTRRQIQAVLKRRFRQVNPPKQQSSSADDAYETSESAIDDTTLHDSLEAALTKAKQKHLFNRVYYEAHCGKFETELMAFSDYVNKSTFSNVNPSANFDTESYLRAHLDVYHASVSPLLHFLEHGEKDKRFSTPALARWIPYSSMVPKDSDTWSSQKIAICLHVFYPDFIEKFSQCVSQFPCAVDVFVTAATEEIAEQANDTFNTIKQVNLVRVAVAQNRGRNFGPFLIEFGQTLLDYDLMCHMHSKKSLYSGREQTQWFDYLNQYLLKDLHVVSCLLRLFDEHQDLGVYYPTSFWMMPNWVNHWTCNKKFAEEYMDDWGIKIEQDFVNYPVGGMFWARPKALAPLLNKKYTYSDFPAEPLPNDGSSLHALERCIGLLAEKQGYKQFFYHPTSAQFTIDKSYAYINYHKNTGQLLNELKNFEIVSFDVFDTLLGRRYVEPDFAKYQLGEYLTDQGIVSGPEAFVSLRNNAEHGIRQSKQFQGDVSIEEVYAQLASEFNCDSAQTEHWMELEFQFDLDLIHAKVEMVQLLNSLSDLGRDIWLITDTYYTQAQIAKMLRKVGVSIPYTLLVSSELGFRKDAGTMWTYVKAKLKALKKSHIHIGDNVRSDAQICGDFGLANMHILHPKDKWFALGFESNSVTNGQLNKYDAIKWGSLMSRIGNYPFIGN